MAERKTPRSKQNDSGQGPRIPLPRWPAVLPAADETLDLDRQRPNRLGHAVDIVHSLHTMTWESEMNEMLKSSTPLAREVVLRDATPADARSLAELIAIAGAGIPEWLWAQMAGPTEDGFDVGTRRAKRDAGGFSWNNAVVAEVDRSVIGMILGYRLKDEDEDLDQMPEILRPFLELERRVPGSWYINAFALYTPWRGRGIGTRLLAAASKRARDLGCRQMSVQTFSETPRSEAFYIRHGFRRIDTRRLPEPSPCHHGGDTVLLLRHEKPA